ncbi:MAG: hypothetical protein AB1513_06895 [Pseudomonadota bacterium]
MAGKLLLCVSGSHAIAARWRGGKLSAYRMFANTDSGWAQFNEYLQDVPGQTVYLMLDVVEEDYRYETLPHASGRDRTELVARKIKQFYRNTPYAAAWLQGRDTGKRRDDRFLFAAMTNPDLLHHWLRIITLQEAPLAGIYLLPMVSLALAEKLGLKQPNLLLISQHNSGLRQTFFREHRLRISRLTLFNAQSQQSVDAAYAEEVANTKLYLETLKMMPADSQLAVAIIDPAEKLHDLNQSLMRQFGDAHCLHFGHDELAARLGIDSELLQQHPETLHLYLLGHYQPPANLAPPALTARHQRNRIKLGLYAASAATLLFSGAWSGANLYQRAELDAQTAQAAADTQIENGKYLAVTRQFPAAPAPSGTLMQTVETIVALKAGLRTPEHAFAVLSRALDASPAIALKSLRWKSGNAADGKAAVAGIKEAKGQQSIEIEAEIKSFKGDYRAAIATIDAFVTLLRQDPGIAEVTVVQLPLNISPVNSLSGTTLESGAPSATASFKLAVALRAAS